MVVVGFYAVMLFLAMQDLRLLRMCDDKRDIKVYMAFMIVAAVLSAVWFAIPQEWGISELLLKGGR